MAQTNFPGVLSHCFFHSCEHLFFWLVKIKLAFVAVNTYFKPWPYGSCFTSNAAPQMKKCHSTQAQVDIQYGRKLLLCAITLQESLADKGFLVSKRCKGDMCKHTTLYIEWVGRITTVISTVTSAILNFQPPYSDSFCLDQIEWLPFSGPCTPKCTAHYKRQS